MNLLSTEEIKQGLDKEFAPLEPMLTGLRLIDGGISETSVDAFESNLNVRLPDEFRKLVRQYSFDRLTIGPVVFCNTGDYLAELLALNSDVRWWGHGVRPPNLLMVANSDPFAILLNLESGEILAMDVERGWQVASVVARNFELFVRGVGTIILRRNENVDRVTLGSSIALNVGGSNQTYWIQLAK